MNRNQTVWRLLRLGFALFAAVSVTDSAGKAAEAPSIKVGIPSLFGGISPVVPTDITNGAVNAYVFDAAVFAWHEFIALNWPALQQNGQVVRDIADPNARLGDPGPLVWESFRHKVEIFPGTNSANAPPHGVNNPQPNDQFGYSDPPLYQYLPLNYPNNGLVPACPGQAPVAQAPFINLDETDEIGQAKMFAGVLNNVPPSASNSSPAQIRYLAKANRAEYDYIVGQQLWYAGTENVPNPLLAAKVNAFTNALASGHPANPADIVSLPTGTIEVKSAWRPLATGEDRSRYHTATVRYYEMPQGAGPTALPCYWQAEWALISLHIIQKTPSAPYFIFATFEQADNLLLPDGKRVEDGAGGIVNPPAVAAPTTPALAYQDGNSSSKAADPIVSALGNGYCDTPGARLYFHENPSHTGTPAGGNICVNNRYEPIPFDIQLVNLIADNQLTYYQQAHNLPNFPWTHYKLVSVQVVPFNAADINESYGSTKHASTYYQANVMVETDYTLQQFKGRIASDGAPTSYPTTGAPLPNFQNVALPNPNSFTTYQMGGCMGCHGNAEVTGTDFSFIVGGNGFSKMPSPPSPADSAEKLELYRVRFGNLPQH